MEEEILPRIGARGAALASVGYADYRYIPLLNAYGTLDPSFLPFEYGGYGGTLPAASVTYVNSQWPSLANVQQALDQLLYITPEIENFTSNVPINEVGQTITSVNLSWLYNKTMTSASLNQGIGSISPTSTSYNATGLSLTTNTTFTLTANDGVNSTTASTTVAFENKFYYGVSPTTTLTNSAILALTSNFATSRQKTMVINGAGEYPVWCYPVSFGLPSQVTVGGFAFTAYTVTTQTLTNASGGVVSYYVFNLNSIQNSTLTIQIT